LTGPSNFLTIANRPEVTAASLLDFGAFAIE
jgi:hypothetical protein